MLTTGLFRDVTASLRRHRAASVVIVATLAILGAATAAILSLAHNLLVAPWDYPTDRLIVLRHGLAGTDNHAYAFGADEYRAAIATGRFQAVSASRSRSVAYGDGVDAARPMLLVHTTPNALAVTGTQPLRGRFVTDADLGQPVVAVAHSFWRSELGGRDDVLGATVQFDGTPHTVIGVMPPRFHFMGGDAWTAHVEDVASEPSTERRYVVNGLLRNGADLPDGASDFDLGAPTTDRVRYPDGWRVEAVRVLDAVIGPQRLAVTLLVAGVLMLAAIGVANLAMLVITRQLADAPTLATRLALGESRARMALVAFVESLLLSAVGIAAASAVGAPLFQLLVDMLSFEWIPRELQGSFVYANPVLGSLPAVALAIAATMTALRVPLLMRLDARAALENAARSGVGRRQLSRLRWLTGAQAALATGVLLCAVAIAAGLARADRAEPGFEPTGAVHARMVFPANRYLDQASRAALLDRLIAEGSGFTAVGFIDAAPLQRSGRSALLALADGRTAPVDYRAFHGDAGSALGIERIEGRAFASTGATEAGGEPVAWINRTLARQLSPDGRALGRSIEVRVGAGAQVSRRVVGIVEDVRHDNGLAVPRPTVYVPFVQEPLAVAAPLATMAAVLRGPAAPGGEAVARWAAAVEPWLALRDVETFDVRAERSLAGVAIARRVFGLFSVLALGVAAIGMAAAASLSIASRRRELAVRCALGRSPRRLWLDAVRDAGTTSTVAALVGSFVVAALFRVRPDLFPSAVELDLGGIVAVLCVIVVAAVAATAWPARRVLATDAASLVRG